MVLMTPSAISFFMPSPETMPSPSMANEPVSLRFAPSRLTTSSHSRSTISDAPLT